MFEENFVHLHETLLIILLILIAVSFFSKKFRIPAVLGFMISGMLIGPNGLGLLSEDYVISIFAEIGASLFLFLVGLEFSFSKIANLGIKPIIIAIIEMGISFFLIYFFTMLLGFNLISSIFLGLIGSVTSTIVAIKILEYLGFLNIKKKEVSLLVGVSVIEDLIIVLLLSALSGMVLGNSISLSFYNVFITIFKVFAFFILSFFFFGRYIPIIFEKIKIEDKLLIGMFYLFFFSSFSFLLGLSTSIGAFVAGSIVRSTKLGEEIEESMKKFELLFTSVFFLSIGLKANPVAAIYEYKTFLLLSFIFLISKFIGVFFSTYFVTSSYQYSTFLSFAMLPMSELSLLMASYAKELGIISEVEFITITFYSIISSISSYIFLSNFDYFSKKFQNTFNNLLKSFQIPSLKKSYVEKNLEIYDEVLRKNSLLIRRIFLYSLYIVVLVSFLGFIHIYVNSTVFLIILLLSLFAIFFLLKSIFLNLREILKEINKYPWRKKIKN